MSMREFAKALGRRGGLRRAQRLSPGERSKIASAGGLARSESFKLAGRIRENFLYLWAMQELAPPPKVDSLKNTHHKLPDIHG